MTSLARAPAWACLLLAALATVQAAVADADNDQSQRGSSQAYVSLLYGDAFLAGIRVLGQSLRETRTERDLVALVTGSVSQAAIDTLRGDGWRVRQVATVHNPGRWTQPSRHKFPARFHAVYTKLLIFNMTEYERVVYLDADTVVARNIDDLFLCDGLCGVMRHSERLNTGVLVLEPSAQLFADMMERVATTPSYTGGDQGFLNSFFSDFMEAPFFDPGRGLCLSAAQPQWTSRTGIRMGRLPTVFNADTGLYVLNSNRWTVPEREIRVLHYTLAVFKPWDWWSGWIMRNANVWQGLRNRVPPSSDGLLHGESQRQFTARHLFLPLPLLLAPFLTYKYLWDAGLACFLHCLCCRLRGGAGSTGRAGSGSLSSASPGGCSPGGGAQHAVLFDPSVPVAFPAMLPAAAILAGMVSLGAALGISTCVIIPNQMRPQYGWLMAYEWTVLLFVLVFSQFLRACHYWGQRSFWQLQGGKPDIVMKQPASGLQRPWGASLWLFTLILGGLGLIPWWADIARVEAFGTKVILTAVAGAITALVVAQAFIELAANWYQCGRTEARNARSTAIKHLQV